jgi:hypothetical protein
MALRALGKCKCLWDGLDINRGESWRAARLLDVKSLGGRWQWTYMEMTDVLGYLLFCSQQYYS